MTFFHSQSHLEKLSLQTRFDERFNDKRKVDIESQVALFVMDNPSAEMLHVIQKVSHCLQRLIISSAKKSLYKILSLEESKKYLFLFLHPNLPQIGKIPNEMWNEDSAVQSILNILAIPVGVENFKIHIQLVQSIAQIIGKRFLHEKRLPIAFDVYSDFLFESFHQLYPEKIHFKPTHAWIIEYYHSLVTICTPDRRDRSDDISPKSARFSQQKVTTVPGIYARSSFVPAPSSIEQHIRGGDHVYIAWQEEQQAKSPFLQAAADMNIPLVSGASGSSIRWLQFLRFLGMGPKSPFSASDFKHYTATMVCFFVYCGHHSMHEVAHIIKLCGGEYTIGDMKSLIPEDMLTQNKFNEIAMQSMNQLPVRQKSFSL